MYENFELPNLKTKIYLFSWKVKTNYDDNLVKVSYRNNKFKTTTKLSFNLNKLFLK